MLRAICDNGVVPDSRTERVNGVCSAAGFSFVSLNAFDSCNKVTQHKNSCSKCKNIHLTMSLAICFDGVVPDSRAERVNGVCSAGGFSFVSLNANHEDEKFELLSNAFAEIKQECDWYSPQQIRERAQARKFRGLTPRAKRMMAKKRQGRQSYDSHV